MRIIERKYLSELVDVALTPDIKVITGVRRSGKTSLLNAFADYCQRNMPDANLIRVNLSELDFESLREYHTLYKYINDHIVAGRNNLVLIDEVQLCDHFELAINSLHSEAKCHLIITGSNAFLLSSDLATLFTGRIYPIEVFPFSFSEYLEYYNRQDAQVAFDDYFLDGGFAGSYVYNDRSQRAKYVSDVIDTLILRDVEQRYGIANSIALDSLTDFMMDNISNPTSFRSISRQLEQGGNSVEGSTVGKYVGYLCDAFAFYRIRPYDIKGKRYLNSADKYYLVDQSFRTARLGTRNMDYGRVYENMVAIELLRRGYEVYTGRLYNGEVDFVASRGSEKMYIQVSDDITRPETLNREVRPLLQIKDAYPKLIVARTHHDTYQYEGIQIYDIAEWLVNPA